MIGSGNLIIVCITCFRPLPHRKMDIRRESIVPFLQISGYLLLSLYFGTWTRRNFMSVGASISPSPCSFDYHTKSVSCVKRDLVDIPRYLSNDIRVLNLSLNNLDVLHNNSFRRYTALTELDLSFNDIYFIETAAFYHLERLQCLNTSGNINLNGIKSEMFTWFGNLVHLEMNYCNITHFPHDTFKWMPNLERLLLRGNPMDNINVTICPNKEMKQVSLSETSFQKVTHETFSFPCESALFEFEPIGVHIVDPDVVATWIFRTVIIGPLVNRYDFTETMKVYEHFFMGFARSPIVTVLAVINFDGRACGTLDQLKYKGLSRFALFFPENIGHNQSFFGNLPFVRELFVVDSKIPILRPKYFQNMRGLAKLQLVENGITAIDASASEWPPNLQWLVLSGNDLLSFDAKSLQGLDRLSRLYLSDNRRLVSLSLSLVNLQVLDISGTAITRCENLYAPYLAYFLFNNRLPNEYDTRGFFNNLQHFKGMKYLYAIDLSISQITLNELWDELWKRSLFEGLTNLYDLDLHSSDIPTIPSGMFSGLISLTSLDLGLCRITHIDADAFEGLISLGVIYLDGNDIAGLPNDMFHSTAQLELVYLQSNILSYLPDDLFVGAPNLTHLNLFGNEFITFNLSTFVPIKSSLRAIDISENPFQCSCRDKWIISWLRESDVLQGKKATCSLALENTFRGRSLLTIDPNELCETYISLYWSMPFIFIAFLITIVVVHHNRWLLKYKMFLLKLAVLGYREMQDARSHDDFKYDLNIMFVKEDKEWGRDFLVPAIQERLPHFRRIALGDDGLLPGMYYLEAVLYAIENSFKTIVLISRAAIHDDMFMTKFRLAVNHVTHSQVESTVLIFLEDIPEEEMPYLVEVYLSENLPDIFWPQDERGQRNALKQLKKRLMVNLRRTDMIPPE